MSSSRLNRKGLVLAVLIGTALLTAYPVQAQNNTPAGTGPQVVPPPLAGGGAGGTNPPPNKNVNPARHSGVRFADPTGKPVQLHYDADGTFVDATNAWADVLVARVIDQGDELLGATLQPVGDALRAQLAIPAGQGLLVASLRADGPSAQAGLKQNDILLTLAAKPLAAAADLTTLLKTSGESVVPLKVLRAGKPVTIQVRPIYRVTLGPAAERKNEYYIGVSLEPLDGALRGQLALPANQGVLVNDVIGGSPAELAGVRKHDIVLEMDGKPIDSPETLARQVQAVQDKRTTLKLLHAGKPISIPITGAVRKVEGGPQEEAVRFLALRRQLAQSATDAYVSQSRDPNLALSARRDTEVVRQRLDHLEKELQALRRIEAVEKELKALHEAMEKLNETLKADRGTKRD